MSLFKLDAAQRPYYITKMSLMSRSKIRGDDQSGKIILQLRVRGTGEKSEGEIPLGKISWCEKIVQSEEQNGINLAIEHQPL